MRAWHSLDPYVVLRAGYVGQEKKLKWKGCFLPQNARETKEEHLRVLPWMSWPASKREKGNGVKQTIPMPAHSLVALALPLTGTCSLSCADEVFALCHDSWVFSNREHKWHTHTHKLHPCWSPCNSHTDKSRQEVPFNCHGTWINVIGFNGSYLYPAVGEQHPGIAAALWLLVAWTLQS